MTYTVTSMYLALLCERRDNLEYNPVFIFVLARLTPPDNAVVPNLYVKVKEPLLMYRAGMGGEGGSNKIAHGHDSGGGTLGLRRCCQSLNKIAFKHTQWQQEPVFCSASSHCYLQITQEPFPTFFTFVAQTWKCHHCYCCWWPLPLIGCFLLP